MPQIVLLLMQIKLSLGAFAKLQKASISFTSVRLSTCPHGTLRLLVDGVSLNLMSKFFFLLKICRKIQVSFKSDKNKL